MAHKKESFIKCAVCGAALKSANLLQHKAKTHAELLTGEEKALLSPKKPAVREIELPESLAAWHSQAKERYFNEKRRLNGTLVDSIWSCLASALFEAAREKDIEKIRDYDSPEIKRDMLTLLDQFRGASRKKLQTAEEKKERSQMRENIEVAKRAIELVKALSLKEICMGVTSYLNREIPDGLEAAYRESILINPYNVAARGNLADLLEKEGRNKEAQREYSNLKKYQ